MKKFDQLPSELISLVFKHVDKTDLCAWAVVNSLFYKITMPILWENLEIDDQDTLIKIIHAMTTCSPHAPGVHVRHMTLGACNLEDSTLLAIIQHVPLLEELRLERGPFVTDASFQHVPSHCPLLTNLYIWCADISHVSMLALGQHCHQLSTLKLIYCPYLDHANLFYALRACPLKVVQIEPCDMDDEDKNNEDDHLKDSSQRFAEKMALGLGHHHRLVTSLTFSNWSNDYTSFITTVNTRGMCWPHLTYLSLDSCCTLDDSGVIRFIQAHPRLQYLALCNSKQITDKTLDAIAAYLPNTIKEVVVVGTTGITAAGICRLVKHCTNLEKGIDLTDCGIHWYDKPFPLDLDKCFYKTPSEGYFDRLPNEERDYDQIFWFAGDALDDYQEKDFIWVKEIECSRKDQAIVHQQ